MTVIANGPVEIFGEDIGALVAAKYKIGEPVWTNPPTKKKQKTKNKNETTPTKNVFFRSLYFMIIAYKKHNFLTKNFDFSQKRTPQNETN